MAGKLFEYVVLYHPKARKAKGDEDGERTTDPSEIIVDLKRVIAKDDKTVAIVAAREIPEKFIDRLEQVEIIVRPF